MVGDQSLMDYSDPDLLRNSDEVVVTPEGGLHFTPSFGSMITALQTGQCGHVTPQGLLSLCETHFVPARRQTIHWLEGKADQAQGIMQQMLERMDQQDVLRSPSTVESDQSSGSVQRLRALVEESAKRALSWGVQRLEERRQLAAQRIEAEAQHLNAACHFEDEISN